MPHPPHPIPHHPHHPPHPPHHSGWENPLPLEQDLATLKDLLNDDALADSLWSIWKYNSPLEVAAIGAVVLHVYDAIRQAFPERFNVKQDRS